MKIDHVILSSNDNPDYINFWPIVSEAWSLMGVEPILIYTGEKNIKLKGNIINFNSKKLDSAFVAQNIRILFPALLENKNCIVSDIDNLPLSKKYFLDSVIKFADDSFIIYRPEACPPNMISMMWNLANSSTWKEIFKIENIKDIHRKLNRWYNYKYSVRGKAWYTDQIKLRKYVNKFAINNHKRIILLNDDELNFKRFNRTELDEHFKIMKTKPESIFSDFHMPRPFIDYENIIYEVYENYKKNLKV